MKVTLIVVILIWSVEKNALGFVFYDGFLDNSRLATVNGLLCSALHCRSYRYFSLSSYDSAGFRYTSTPNK